MFFDKMNGGAGMGPGMGGMGGGGASAFTSPGMNPQSLAALMAMFSGGGGAGPMAGPQIPMPNRAAMGGPTAPAFPAIAQPGAAAMPQAPKPAAPAGGSLMQMLSQLDPAKLQELLASLGMSGGPGMTGGPGMLGGGGLGIDRNYGGGGY